MHPFRLLISLLLLAPLAGAPLAQAQQAARPSLGAVTLEAGRWTVRVGTLALEGNAVWPVADGWLTLTSHDGVGIAATLRSYDGAGRERHRADFPQVLNLAVAPDGATAAFHDGRHLHALNLQTFTDHQIVDAGLAFAAGPDGMLAWVDAANSAVRTSTGATWHLPAAPHQLLYWRGQLVALTRVGLYALEATGATPLRTAPAGGALLRLREDESSTITSLMLTERVPAVAGTTLRTWRATGRDLARWTLTETRPVAPPVVVPALAARPTASGGPGHFGRPTSTREPIRGPLNYAADSVFGPVGNSYGEIQAYGGGSVPYLHPGVDLLGVPGQEVRSVKAGVVKAVLTTSAQFHWRVAIAYGPQDSLAYLYAHVEEATIPFAPGDAVVAGDLIGNLVTWPVPGFDHCHFARIVDNTRLWTGDWWTVDHPVADLINHRDHEAPTYNPVGIGGAVAVLDPTGQELHPDSVHGRVALISQPSERCNSPTYDIDLYDERYALRPVSGGPAVLDTLAWCFDMRTDVYGPSSYSTLVFQTLYARTASYFSLGDYTSRAFYHYLTHGTGDNRIQPTDSLRLLNTAAYPDGDYWLTLTAHDASGNAARDSVRLRLRNGVLGTAAATAANALSVWPNPVTGDWLTVRGAAASEPLRLTDALGRTWALPEAPTSAPAARRFDARALPPGVYWLAGPDARRGRRLCRP